MKKLSLLVACLFLFANVQLFAAGSPPGLSGKGGAAYPHGLQKQGKTPYGWSHGKKKGWNKDWRNDRLHRHQHLNHPRHTHIDAD